MSDSFENLDFSIQGQGSQCKCLKFICPDFRLAKGSEVLKAQFLLETPSYELSLRPDTQTFIFRGINHENESINIELRGKVECQPFSNHCEVYNIFFFELKIAERERYYYDFSKGICRIDGVDRNESIRRNIL
jgi:hypothetical protein